MLVYHKVLSKAQEKCWSIFNKH